MSTESIRTSLIAAVESAKPAFSDGYTLLIQYDNLLTIDTKTQQNPYLKVEIDILDGRQKNLSSKPTQKISGMLIMAAVVKVGSGMMKANKLRDYFGKELMRKNFSGVRTEMSTFTRDYEKDGWLYAPVVIPFWASKNPLG